MDVHQGNLYPPEKEPEDVSLPVPGGYAGSDYLELVREALPEVLEALRPELLVYNAGSDPFIDDPLAGLRLTRAELVERDLLVATLARERGIPLAMVLSGGYSAESWRIHADGIEEILARFGR